MKVKRTNEVADDPDDKSFLMHVSEREYKMLYTLIAYTVGGNQPLVDLTMGMFKDMRDVGGVNWAHATIEEDCVKLREEGWPYFKDLQH